MKIGVRCFKPVHITGSWNYIDSFINVNIYILRFITDIQNYGSESMHICDRNVDYKGFSMCHWTVVLIKINTLNLRTPIFTVARKELTCIITVAPLNK